MSAKKKSSNIILVVMIIFLAAIGLGVTLPLVVLHKNEGIEKVVSTSVSKDEVYNSIINADLINHYPKSPEDVADFYCKVLYMVYGNLVTDDSALKAILEKQRMVYSDELAQNTPENQQITNIKNAMKESVSKGNLCIKVERKETVANPSNPDMKEECLVQVVLGFKRNNNIYRLLQMVYDDKDERWKVRSWKDCDQNFIPLPTE